MFGDKPYTAKELKEKSGPVTHYKLDDNNKLSELGINRPMTLKEIKTLSEDKRKKYLDEVIYNNEKFYPTIAEVNKLLQTSTAKTVLEANGIKIRNKTESKALHTEERATAFAQFCGWEKVESSDPVADIDNSKKLEEIKESSTENKLTKDDIFPMTWKELERESDDTLKEYFSLIHEMFPTISYYNLHTMLDVSYTECKYIIKKIGISKLFSYDNNQKPLAEDVENFMKWTGRTQYPSNKDTDKVTSELEEKEVSVQEEQDQDLPVIIGPITFVSSINKIEEFLRNNNFKGKVKVTIEQI